MQTSEIGAAKFFASDTKASDTDTKAFESETKGSDTDTKAFESETKGCSTKASGNATKAFDCGLFGLGKSEAVTCCSMLVPGLVMLHMGIEGELKLEGCRPSSQDESPQACWWNGCGGLKTQVPKLRLLCHCHDGVVW